MDNYTYNKFQEAKKKKDIRLLEELYKNNKTDYIIAFEYAKLLIKIKKFKTGKEILLSLLKTPNWAYATLELGKLEFEQGNIEKARIYFETLERMGNSKDKNCARLELGKLEFSQGNIEDARIYFKKLIREGDTKDKNCAILELGKLEFSIGNIEEARNYFTSLLNTPNKNYATLELGRLEFSVGNIDKARNYFISLLNTPNKNYATLELGRLEFSVGNTEKARNYFISLLTTSSWTYATLELGKLEFYCGNTEDAIKYFTALSTNTVDISGKLYSILNLIKIRIKQKDYLSAINYLNYLNNSKLSFDLKAQVEILKLYLGKELNIFFKNGIKINFNYNNNQFLNYNASTAIKHIIDKHKNDFSDHINIYKLFKEIKEKLIKPQKISHLDINDIYDIPYQNVGNNCHILRVVTLPNTTNILTMYPLNANNFYLTDELSYNSNLKLQRKK